MIKRVYDGRIREFANFAFVVEQPVNIINGQLEVCASVCALQMIITIRSINPLDIFFPMEMRPLTDLESRVCSQIMLDKE